MKQVLLQARLLDKFMWWGVLFFLASNMFSIAIVQTTVIVLGLLLAAQWILERDRKFVRTPFDIPFLLFVLARIVSIPFSVNFEASLEAFNKEIIFYVIFFVITQRFPLRDKKKVKIAVWVIVLCAVVAALIGSTKFLLNITDRAESTTSGAVTLGMYLSAVLSVLLVLGKNKEYFPSRVIWFGASFVIMIGIVCTLNRIHWGIMFLVIVAIGLVQERKLLLALCVAIVMGGTMIPQARERVAASFYNIHALTTGRDIIWSEGWSLIKDRPIVGYGPRTFHAIFPAFNKVPDKRIGSWHNDYLQVYMESGLLGLGSFLALMGAVFWFGWRARLFLKSDPFYQDLASGLLLAMGVFYLSGLVGGFVIDPISSLLYRFFLAMLGLLCALGPSHSGESQGHQVMTS